MLAVMAYAYGIIAAALLFFALGYLVDRWKEKVYQKFTKTERKTRSLPEFTNYEGW